MWYREYQLSGFITGHEICVISRMDPADEVKGDNYIFAMNGQTGKFVGNLPTDKNAFCTMVPGNNGGRGCDHLYYPVSDLGFVGRWMP